MTRTTLSPLVLAAACLLVLLAGCGQAGPTPTPWIVTATPDVPTSTPTPVASPTLEPSPTPVPDIALRTAQLHLTNGDYEAAVLTFQSVLSQPTDAVAADVRASAAYGLGEAALREGLFQETVNALTSFLAQYPADGRVPQAYFMRGDAMLGLGQWQPAIIDFQQYLALRPGVIDSYALERIETPTWRKG
jgi:tetratricopeptide (TPR) repeat protein